MLLAEKEEIEKDIKHAYNQLLNSIDHAKEKALSDNSKEIKLLLTNEILKRYFYKEGRYKYNVIHNEEIKEAISVLNDIDRYKKILGY